MSYRQAVLIGIALGFTAAVVVWYFERLKTDRFHRDVRLYLNKYDEFRDWLSAREKSE